MRRVLSILFGLAILVVAGLTLALFREVNGSAIAAVDATKTWHASVIALVVTPLVAENRTPVAAQSTRHSERCTRAI